MNKGRVILFSGPSGSGKGTIVSELCKRRNDRIYLSISATTRAPRGEEQNGKEYYFLTREEFEKKISQNQMLEYAEYNGNYYGTPLEPVLKAQDEGRDVILEIEVQGAHKVKKKCPDARLVFVVPPSAEILKKRLSGRGTETADVIENRMRIAVGELEQAFDYEYILINGELSDAVDEMEKVIDGDMININEKKEFLKGVINNVKTLCK